jgi:hypothetical protein
MRKNDHEIRDPIHVFVRLDTQELKMLDAWPFQRLRHIHQLGLTYLLYPSATHCRFEHSLGVMELASRIFDVITNASNVHKDAKECLPELGDKDGLAYWRRVLRAAALCHDLGHMPFSHSAESSLLPASWDHERLTREVILSEQVRSLLNLGTPPIRSSDVAKLAIGPKKAKDQELKAKDQDFTDWEAILAEIIVGDAFGADRMDYLLRDSHHLGVAYGRFDH